MKMEATVPAAVTTCSMTNMSKSGRVIQKSQRARDVEMEKLSETPLEKRRRLAAETSRQNRARESELQRQRRLAAGRLRMDRLRQARRQEKLLSKLTAVHGDVTTELPGRTSDTTPISRQTVETVAQEVSVESDMATHLDIPESSLATRVEMAVDKYTPDPEEYWNLEQHGLLSCVRCKKSLDVYEMKMHLMLEACYDFTVISAENSTSTKLYYICPVLWCSYITTDLAVYRLHIRKGHKESETADTNGEDGHIHDSESVMNSGIKKSGIDILRPLVPADQLRQRPVVSDGTTSGVAIVPSTSGEKEPIEVKTEEDVVLWKRM